MLFLPAIRISGSVVADQENLQFFSGMPFSVFTEADDRERVGKFCQTREKIDIQSK